MHGENVQKKRGKKVRGRFGTGKSAAFGLANYLMIDTTQSKLRNVVELSREKINKAKNGEPFPVDDIIVNQQTNDDDGTTIEIREFNVNRIDIENVIAYIERHLSRYHLRAHVTINGHECKFEEPVSVDTYEKHPPRDVSKHIGNVNLIIKVSPTPLDDDNKGIDIFSNGLWHGTTLAGVEKKEKANYLFGQIEVPILEEGEWPIPAFDNTRNNTLNTQNPVVVVLLGWIAEELEIVRLELIEKDRKRRQTEEAIKLAKEAQKIAEIINKDFAQQEMEFELSKRVSMRSGGKSISEILDEHGDLWPGNGQDVTPWEQLGTEHGSGKRGERAGEGDIPRPGPSIREGNEPGAKKSQIEGQQKRRNSGFSIEFENATSHNPRSRYDGNNKAIYINLDHPQINSIYEDGGRSSDNKY